MGRFNSLRQLGQATEGRITQAEQLFLDGGQGQPAFLEPLDRHKLKQMTTVIDSGPSSHLGGAIQQTERRVITNGPLIGDIADAPIGGPCVVHR
jgi:hypothetical protein